MTLRTEQRARASRRAAPDDSATSPTPRRKLRFTTYETPEGISLAAIAPNLLDRCGIYVLELADGREYVGQTVTVLTRFATHRRHVQRRKWPDIVAIRFATAEQDELDQLEVEVIRLEKRRHHLVNLLLTTAPGGAEDLEVPSPLDGHPVSLPLRRAERTTLAEIPHSSKDVRFWRLSAIPCYPALRSLLARYVAETIPAPNDTQEMWTLTALPSTHGRLSTLTVGDTETLYCGKNDKKGASAWAVLNVSDKSSRLVRWLDQCKLTVEHEPARYRVARDHPARRIVCCDLEVATLLLEHPIVLDAAYLFNVVLMRRGSHPNRGKHNIGFASDILYAAWKDEGDNNLP